MYILRKELQETKDEIYIGVRPGYFRDSWGEVRKDKNDDRNNV